MTGTTAIGNPRRNRLRPLIWGMAACLLLLPAVAMQFENFVGMSDEGMPDFWITPTDKTSSGTHIAFRTDRARVDAFYAAALAAGGVDNGAPGLRADYHPHYYAAYVIDPEGNNVEVVCHDPPGMPKVPPARTAAARRPAKRALAKRPARKAK